MKLPPANWRERDGMDRLLDCLDAGGGSTRFVGGCVRDALLRVDNADVDLATRLQPDDVLGRLRRASIKAVPTGIAHGTVTAVLRGGPVEVTTLRRDVATDGRRATIAWTEDWQEDAARRDFTMNALSADPVGGEIFDYFNGIHDLNLGCVRFIGDALTRIAEDHLRILRFFRFYARFGRGEPDADAIAACAARANDLMALSRERIADELLKLLTLPQPVQSVALMLDNGILAPVLPEIEPTAAHRLAALVTREQAAGIPPHPLRRLAALLPQDVGVANAVAARLRLSNHAGKRLAAAAARDGSEAADPFVAAYYYGKEETIDRILLGDATVYVDSIRALVPWEKPRLGLGGGKLIAMGLSPGPAVAKTLQEIEREWVARGCPPGAEWIDQLARKHVDQLLRDNQ